MTNIRVNPGSTGSNDQYTSHSALSAATLARIADASPTQDEAPPAVLPRGGHTELSLDRFTHEDARIRRGGGLPACGSFFS
ncbi:hypothetical protein AFCDBAGC_3724 [Methylobacterium cerastii]|uniref:Uncharacterized protein n=1 Tax=Methylobacterium cerastii TaxID=932741 RepID=A0ABQ4QLW1_9HYPH|nr:hypothetical protein AFCDBAGC_3724 [Methylobacterium cerastii]